MAEPMGKVTAAGNKGAVDEDTRAGWTRGSAAGRWDTKQLGACTEANVTTGTAAGEPDEVQSKARRRGI